MLFEHKSDNNDPFHRLQMLFLSDEFLKSAILTINPNLQWKRRKQLITIILRTFYIFLLLLIAASKKITEIIVEDDQIEIDYQKLSICETWYRLKIIECLMSVITLLVIVNWFHSLILMSNRDLWVKTVLPTDLAFNASPTHRVII